MNRQTVRTKGVYTFIIRDFRAIYKLCKTNGENWPKSSEDVVVFAAGFLYLLIISIIAIHLNGKILLTLFDWSMHQHTWHIPAYAC